MPEENVLEVKRGGFRKNAGRKKTPKIVGQDDSNKAQVGMMGLYKLALKNLKEDMTSQDEKIRQNASLYVSRTILPDKIEAKDNSEGLNSNELTRRVLELLCAKIDEARNLRGSQVNAKTADVSDIQRPPENGGVQDNEKDRLLQTPQKAISVPSESKT